MAICVIIILSKNVFIKGKKDGKRDEKNMLFKELRKGSVISQVAIMFALCILVTGALTYYSQYYNANRFVVSEAKQRAELVNREVKAAVYEYPAYKWLLRYWYDHAFDMDIEYDAEYTEGTVTEEKARLLSERHPELQLKYATEAEIEALPPEDQKLYAEVTYSWLITHLDQIKRVYKPAFLYCVATVPPYDNQFFMFSGADRGAVRGTAYNEVYTIGVNYKVDESIQGAMRSAIRNRGFFSQSNNYIDYYSFLYGYDKVEMLIGLTYDQNVISKDIEDRTARGSMLAMAFQLLLSIIMSICFYLIALKPLKKVQANIRMYKDTKDSSIVEKNLEEIHVNNEIGELAVDVRDLAREMDAYHEEISIITAEKERIGAELAVANQIQASMLPHIFPPFPEREDFDIYASMDPAKEVGGDFYDYLLLDDDHLYLLMADVSGKGIPAALFMMASKNILASIAREGKSPKGILESANNIICSNNQEDMFVTVWLGILEISTGKLTAANAGHEYPAIRKPDGKYELLKDKHGFVLGGMAGMKYSEYELTLEPGTEIFLYTDGVPEATSAEKELFGTDRMLEALNDEPDANPMDTLLNVRAYVDAFVKEAEQFDDLTMLNLVYKGKK